MRWRAQLETRTLGDGYSLTTPNTRTWMCAADWSKSIAAEIMAVGIEKWLEVDCGRTESKDTQRSC